MSFRVQSNAVTFITFLYSLNSSSANTRFIEYRVFQNNYYTVAILHTPIAVVFQPRSDIMSTVAFLPYMVKVINCPYH